MVQMQKEAVFGGPAAYWGKAMSKLLMYLQASGRILENTAVCLWERALPRVVGSRPRFTCSAGELEALWQWMVEVSYIRKLFSQDLKNSVLEAHILSILKWSFLLLKAKCPVCKKKKNGFCQTGPAFLILPIPPLAPGSFTSAASDYSFWGFFLGRREASPFFYLLSGECSPGFYSWLSSLLCTVLLVPAGELPSKQRYFSYYPCSYYSPVSKILALAFFLS